MSIIWITGLPNAGKTSVADEVAALIRERGRLAIRLDGDQMRVLFGWTEARAEPDRIALGIRYVRLAQELARQGAVVIVSVVGLYREVFDALMDATNPLAEVVLVDAPDEELLRRDDRQIYAAGRLAELRAHLNVLPQGALRIENANCSAPTTASRLLSQLVDSPILSSVPTIESMNSAIARLARDEALARLANGP